MTGGYYHQLITEAAIDTSVDKSGTMIFLTVHWRMPVWAYVANVVYVAAPRVVTKTRTYRDRGIELRLEWFAGKGQRRWLRIGVGRANMDIARASLSSIVTPSWGSHGFGPQHKNGTRSYQGSFSHSRIASAMASLYGCGIFSAGTSAGSTKIRDLCSWL